MISRTVRAILAFTSTPPEAFWHSVGMSRSTYYNRINGETPWSASDVQHAADTLRVISVADLYEGRVPLGLPQYDGAIRVTAEFPEPRPGGHLWDASELRLFLGAHQMGLAA